MGRGYFPLSSSSLLLRSSSSRHLSKSKPKRRRLQEVTTTTTSSSNMKRPLDLNWNALLSDNDDPPDDVVIEETKQSKELATLEWCRGLSDKEIDCKIKSRGSILSNLGVKLPDGGDKLRVEIKMLEKERERRELLKLDKDELNAEKVVQSDKSKFNGSYNGFKQRSPTSWPRLQSNFGYSDIGELEDQAAATVSDKKKSNLGRFGLRNLKLIAQSSIEITSKSKHSPFQSPINLSVNKDQHSVSNDYRKKKISPFSFPEQEKSWSPKKMDTSRIFQENKMTDVNEQSVILLDEDDPQLVEAVMEEDDLVECLEDTIIHYPSSDDPEAVIVSKSQIECLRREAFLTSSIMNFYIQYLKQLFSRAKETECNYQLFNTYFYTKLKEAVSGKGDDKRESFTKFRRWWKGVDIFEKGYLLIPIHEGLHWSLVIVCMPKEKDMSGPVILHLDSLGLHESRVIFNNIRSFIEEERDHIMEEAGGPDLLISQRIEEKIIEVPQQKNACDCGLFVLFFMQCFIEEAPKNLKLKNLTMFGKHWFRPEEASNLRWKIRRLLVKEFRNAK